MRILQSVFVLLALALIFVVEAVPFDNDDGVPDKRADAQLSLVGAPSSTSSMASIPSIAACPPKNKRSTKLNVRATQFQAIFMSDGRTYRLTATDRLGSGEHGIVYDVQENCNWVAKILTQDSDGSEVNNLHAISELVAYSGSGTKVGDWIVMIKQTGVQLQYTAEYRAASNQDQRAAVVDKAYGYVYAKAQHYVSTKGVLNLDLDKLENVLFVEQNGQIVEANLVDWEYTTTDATQEDLDEDAENWRSNWYRDYVY